MSARLYGRASPSFIPHNFYRIFRTANSIPRLHQISALSRISGIHLYDWLAFFGLDLTKIVELQLLLPKKRTILLNRPLKGTIAEVPWFRDLPGQRTGGMIVPIGSVVERHASILTTERAQSLYVRIGSEDALTFPELLPGSIVRVNPWVIEHPIQLHDDQTVKKIFLIEHSKGIWCSQLQFVGGGRIRPVSCQLPYAEISFQSPHEIRILGVADLEIRRTTEMVPAEVPKDLLEMWRPSELVPEKRGFGQLLSRARERSDLSFREVSAISRQVADFIGNGKHFIAPSTLSDYETREDPPRHFAKLISLCAIYGIGFEEVLNSVGIEESLLGQERLLENPLSVGGMADSWAAEESNPNLQAFLARCGEVPFFLRYALAALSGMKRVTFRDIFLIGAETKLHPPHLSESLLIVVDRSKKKPLRLPHVPLADQPLYVLLLREGQYRCASCSLEGGDIVPHPQLEALPLRLRNHLDAEVIGQVAAVVRKLP
jgi:transcriptional regulator with XRE-family HTH domain